MSNQADVHRRIFESAVDPIVVVGTDGAFLDANRAARETGLVEDAVRQVALRKLSTDDVSLVDRTGTTRVFVPMEQRVGATHVFTYRDVTALRAAEEALAHGRRIESLGHVTIGAVHDFANLLTPILCAASLLRGASADPAQVEQLAGEIHGAAERAAGLVEQLMSFSRRRPAQIQRVDANATLLALRPLLVRALPEAITLELALGEGSLPVRVDRSRFETAILNLVTNARDAMPRGGKIVISTGIDESAGSGSAFVSVADDGDGMTAEVHARVFDEFFTTKPPGRGTGLGLPAVQAFVVASGGHLTIDSALERGTNVRLFLPPDDSPREPVTVAPPSRQDVRGGRERIVIVEDDESVRRSLRVVLEERGYGVVEASSPGVALELVRGGDVDIVIIDRVLRKGSGATLARSVRAASPRTQVLLVSGHVDLEQDVDDLPFLAKPIDRATLLRRVRAVLDQPSLGTSAPPPSTRP
ncbi:MAG TPA: ATP-binding protein [Polyangiaceae bacterium]|nr:ATP-binding protein [Polyangiaceae bacterium]